MAEMDTLKQFGDKPKHSLNGEPESNNYDFEEQFKQDSTAYYYEN